MAPYISIIIAFIKLKTENLYHIFTAQNVIVNAATVQQQKNTRLWFKSTLLHTSRIGTQDQSMIKPDLKPSMYCLADGVQIAQLGGVDENLCRICMDAVIDCVLLECGHMVTCTKCGKRMNECPICRQYVIRAVHVFKS